jgi:hypothetical protein
MIDVVLSTMLMANILFYAATFFSAILSRGMGQIKEGTGIWRPPKLKEAFSRTAEVFRARYGASPTHPLGKGSRNGEMGKTENEKT